MSRISGGNGSRLRSGLVSFSVLFELSIQQDLERTSKVERLVMGGRD